MLLIEGDRPVYAAPAIPLSPLRSSGQNESDDERDRASAEAWDYLWKQAEVREQPEREVVEPCDFVFKDR